MLLALILRRSPSRKIDILRKNNAVQHRYSGFTLTEPAIALMVIGSLPRCALKGQQLIDMAKVEELGTDFRNVPTLINTCMDMFHAQPGDDARASNQLRAGVIAQDG